MTPQEHSARIAALNDEFRHRGHGGIISFSEQIQARGDAFVSHVKAVVAADEGFTLETDPRGRRDFGVVTVEGVRVCWKIDYQHEEDPTLPVDPAQQFSTLRLLTIFTPLEY